MVPNKVLHTFLSDVAYGKYTGNPVIELTADRIDMLLSLAYDDEIQIIEELFWVATSSISAEDFDPYDIVEICKDIENRK